MSVDYERKIVYCDCCARQIVDRDGSDRYWVGPRSSAVVIGINLHCCHACLPEYREWETIEMARA